MATTPKLPPGKDEIDDQVLVGLAGVLKVSHAIVHGISVLNLDAFKPLSRWKTEVRSELAPRLVLLSFQYPIDAPMEALRQQ